MPSTGNPPRLATRLRVAFDLLTGLHDIRSARQFMKIRFGQDAAPVRLLKLLRWALHISWRLATESLVILERGEATNVDGGVAMG